MKWIHWASGVIIVFFSFARISAQEIKLYSNAEVDRSLDSLRRVTCERVTGQLVNDFISCATFVDFDGNFDKKKYNKLTEEVLHSESVIYNFYLNKPKSVMLPEFKSFVTRYLTQGIEFSVRSAEISDLKVNSSDDVEITVDLSLDVFGTVDENGDFRTLVKGRVVDLKLIIVAIEGNEENARIFRVEGVSERVRQPGGLMLFAGGIGLLNGKIYQAEAAGTFFEGVTADISGPSLGLQALKTLGKGNVLLWTGVQFNSIQVNTIFSSTGQPQVLSDLGMNEIIPYVYYSPKGFDSLSVPSYIDSLENITFTESLPGLTSIDILLGAKYKFNVGTNDRFLLGFALCPRFSFAKNDGTRTVRIGGYILPKDLTSFPTLEEIVKFGVLEEYRIDKTIDIENVEVNSNFNMSMLFNASYQRQISFKWGVEVGLGYQIDLTNRFKSNSAPDVSLGRSTSVIEDYFNGSRSAGLQMQASFFYKLNNYF